MVDENIFTSLKYNSIKSLYRQGLEYNDFTELFLYFHIVIKVEGENICNSLNYVFLYTTKHVVEENIFASLNDFFINSLYRLWTRKYLHH